MWDLKVGGGRVPVKLEAEFPDSVATAPMMPAPELPLPVSVRRLNPSAWAFIEEEAEEDEHQGVNHGPASSMQLALVPAASSMQLALVPARVPASLPVPVPDWEIPAEVVHMDLRGVYNGPTVPTAWFTLPGPDAGKSSQVRMVAAPPRAGLMFLPWGNYGGIRNPARPEYTLEFTHCRDGGFHNFVLEPGDIFIRCPMQFPWPVCFGCKKFLFPHEDHRASRSHVKWLRYVASAGSMQDLEKLYKWKAESVWNKHRFGENFFNGA